MMMRTQGFSLIVSALFLCHGAKAAAGEAGRLAVSPGGHYLTYAGKTLLAIGESGTQCVTQNANLDYRAWIDDCAERGIRLIHVWSLMAPRQTQDGAILEDRWGYLYPGITPWPRMSAGPAAADGLPQWDLRAFDDGADTEVGRYWPRLRDMCRYARDKGMLVGITVFTGWAKHPEDWVFHPLNRKNGGPLDRVEEAVRIESPGREVVSEEWSDAWPAAYKTQWIWERFSEALIRQTAVFGNVFFVFLDEHSYDEGNLGDHFAAFFRARGALWMDWDARREQVDMVYSDTYTLTDRNKLAVAGFRKRPARPYWVLEGEPYLGEGMRSGLWTLAVGGGHFAFHADTGQETERTGIMGYDPHVPGGDKGMERREWLGHASRFFNEYVRNLECMEPHNELTNPGNYCLACPGAEYVIYSKAGGPVPVMLALESTTGAIDARFYDPRLGTFTQATPVIQDSSLTVGKPGEEDWVLHVILEAR